nr:hypothetical protein CFP56_09245 [Quercus suber]
MVFATRAANLAVIVNGRKGIPSPESSLSFVVPARSFRSMRSLSTYFTSLMNLELTCIEMDTCTTIARIPGCVYFIFRSEAGQDTLSTDLYQRANWRQEVWNYRTERTIRTKIMVMYHDRMPIDRLLTT